MSGIYIKYIRTNTYYKSYMQFVIGCIILVDGIFLKYTLYFLDIHSSSF